MSDFAERRIPTGPDVGQGTPTMRGENIAGAGLNCRDDRVTERKGDWIQLISGEPFWPLDARPEEVRIDDIAWALSMQCRYAGHVRRRYSVGEHSVMVSRLVPVEHALWGLLHDASEAYLVDLPRPVKSVMPDYQAYENALMRVIAERFGLPWPEPAEVKRADTDMLWIERAQLLAKPRRRWEFPQGGEPTGPVAAMRLPCWSPYAAYRAFLARYRELTGESAYPVPGRQFAGSDAALSAADPSIGVTG